ncbi:HtaA domain-containing protein [Cellulosimicrobium cellulans]|uniref:HtaA domain-containing protein n=1 Tax=Cellulosimicrobium cellulans TaxID=1710 RepID=UPI001966813B|nr:HtaA domain-containing protein [Cellulosimicrobium cellulans]MBN0039202.1 HtaA domain-containing protein [Cellulosimicrobium cellulans]
MRTSPSRRVRRGLASFLAAALAAGLTVAGAGAPAQAATAEIQGGSATWNFVDSWASYVTGPIAHGSIAPEPVDGRSVYSPASGTYDDETGTGTVHLGGSTRYQGHGGQLDLTISDVTLELTGPGTGTLRADFSGTVEAGQGQDVVVADVTVSATRHGDQVTFVANGAIDSLASVSSYLSMYDSRAISTLTATVTVPEPAAPAVATATTLAVAPAGTSTRGADVTLTATVAPAADGTVEFRDGSAAIGTAAVSGGVATLRTGALAVGSHDLSASFTPADPTAFVASASAPVAHRVTAVVTEPEPEPVADPEVTVTPSSGVDPTVENTFTVSGTGFVGPAARFGAYVLVGEKSIWAGDGPLVSSGWLAQGWVMPQQVVDGAFTTTLTVPAGSFDPAKEYVVATSAAHGLSATDRRLDTFTPVTLEGGATPEPVWEPSIELFAADGTTPLGDTAVREGDPIVVKGSGFDPAANVGGRGVPIPATLPQGTYVVFGKFAEEWRPSQGVASSARKVVSQQWALAGSVLDQVPAQFQGTIRNQWAEIEPDGTFEARLTAGSVDAVGRYGVYTYGAPGVTNAAQELYAPVAFTIEPPAPVWEPEIAVFAEDGETPLGDTEVSVGDTIVVKGSGFDPAANVGGRGVPIPATLPQGTYVVFGSFAEQWRPSEGAASSTREVGSQVWALAEPVLDQVPPQFRSVIRAQWTDIAEDGTFEARLVVKNPAALEGGRYGVYTYGAGGVTNADQELFAPVAFDVPASLTVTPAAATVEAGETVDLTVRGLVEGDAVKGVTFGGKPATYTNDGTTIRLTVPAGAAAGSVPVVVTSDLGVTGTATLTVTAPAPEPTPTVTVSPSGPVDPAVENTLTVSGTGFLGDGARFGAYVLIGEESIWDGTGPLVATGWLQLAWVMPQQVVDGAFTTTLTVPAGSFDPSKEYVVATSAAHGLSATDRSLDTFTRVAVRRPAPEARPTTTALVSSAASVVEGTAVTFTATVTPKAAGTVRFTAGDTTLGTATVVDGVASYRSSGLAVGSHAVTATFVPTDSTAFVGSASSPVTVKVTAKPSVPTTAGSLTWGVKESFRRYIVGPVADGGASASSGAAVVDGLFRFGQAEGGTWTAASGRGSVKYSGTVRFTGHSGALDLALTNPVVDVTGPGAGRLLVDARSTGLDGSTFDRKGVVFATLALGAPTTSADGAVTYTKAAATLTADGSLAFSGFYPAGTVLDPVTFTVGATSAAPGGGGTIGTPGTGTPGTPADPARATLSVSQAAPGDEVTISGVGFGAHEAGIRTEIRSTPRTLATGVTANAGGAASSTVTIPTDVAPGEHTLLLIGADHTASAQITIVGAGTTGTGTGSGSAAEQCFAQGVNGATLSWGVSDRFRAYVTGPIAKGSVSTDGVRDGGSAFTWSGGKGSFNTDLGKGRASFGGAVSFSGHEGILDLRISNPRVVVNGSSGTLVVDVRSSDMEGNTSSSNGVAFASLDLSGKKSTSGSTITWSGAPATLTAAGAKAFAGFYEAGTALSPVTFTFPVGGDVECDAYSGALASTGTDAGSLALLAGTLLLTGGAILTVRRRRAGRVQAAATA